MLLSESQQTPVAYVGPLVKQYMQVFLWWFGLFWIISGNFVIYLAMF